MTTTQTAGHAARLKPRRLFADFCVARQVWEGIGCALVAGAITGFALGTNAWLYMATATIAAIAGIPAATQHLTLRGALLRTGVGGFAWAAAVIVVFVARGQDAVFPVLQPQWYLITTTVPALAVGWLVWAWSNRPKLSPA